MSIFPHEVIQYSSDSSIFKKREDNTLMKAFSRGDYVSAEKIIQSGSSREFEKTDKNGRNALHYVCNKYNKFQNPEKTLSRALKYVDVNSRDNFGNTPLHYSVIGGNHVLAQKLIDFGANKNIRNNNGDKIMTDVSEYTDQQMSDTEKFKNAVYSNENVDTDTIVDALLEKYSAHISNRHSGHSGQHGGKSKSRGTIKSGSRELKSYKKTNSSKKMKKSLQNYQRELERLLNEQTNEIYKRVEDKIMKLLNVSEETAKFYKSTLIYMVKQKAKNENKTLSQVDIATQVESMTTREKLDTIDIEKEKKAILEFREKRKSESSSSSDKNAKRRRKDRGEMKDNGDKKDHGEKKERKPRKSKKDSSSESSMSSSVSSSIYGDNNSQSGSESGSSSSRSDSLSETST